jgi:excisionase family DNA binding protein
MATMATMATIAFKERVTCTVPDACKFTGLGKTTIFEKIADGTLESSSVGRRRLVSVASLLELVAPKSEQKAA